MEQKNAPKMYSSKNEGWKFNVENFGLEVEKIKAKIYN